MADVQTAAGRRLRPPPAIRSRAAAGQATGTAPSGNKSEGTGAEELRDAESAIVPVRRLRARRREMAKVLVNVTCGPNDPNKAALAFFVARAAVEDGHRVALFLAGDAVQLLRTAVLDSLQGLGSGSLREHYDALAS